MAKKRGCYFLTAEEDASPSKLVKFSESVPQVPKSGDSSADEDLKYFRKEMMKVINVLWRNPKMSPRCVDWLDEKFRQDMEASSKSDCFKAISTLGKLDETWAASWLVQHSALTLKVLERVCDVDGDGVRQLMIFALVACLAVKLHAAMKVKAVMSIALQMRHNHCGQRLARLTSINLVCPDTGAINWGTIGVYEPLWDAHDERLWRLRHKPSGHVGRIPNHVIVTRDFKLCNNWDDFDATLVLKPSSFPCSDFFDSGCGPFKVKQWQGSADKNMFALADAAEDQHEEEMNALEAHDVFETPTKFRQTTKAEHKKEGMSAARVALEQKKTQLSNLREVSFR